MKTPTRMATATMIDATSTDNRSLEVIKVNMRSFSITPEPAQEVKNLSFTSQARDAIAGFRGPSYGLLLVVRIPTSECRTQPVLNHFVGRRNQQS